MRPAESSWQYRIVSCIEQFISTMLRLLWWFTVIAAITATCQATRSYYHQCNNYLCNRVDQILKSSLDRKINPCDDFLMYTCGSSNTINSTFATANILDGLRGLDKTPNQEANIFRSILDTNLGTNDPNENVVDSLKIERQIFNNCFLNGVRTDSDKEQYYRSLPENAKNLEQENGFEKATEHWIFSDMEYAYKGYGFAFYDFKIIERADRRKKRYIQISPPTDNILDINTLFAKRYDSQDRHNYPKQTLLAHKKLNIFLEEFNRITLQKSDQEDAVNIDQPQLLSEWQSKWNNRVRRHDTAKIDWKKLIWQHFITAGVTAPNDDIYIIVNEENYFFNLIKLLSSTSVDTLENYVHLRYISKTIGLADKEYIEYSVIPSISKLVCTPGLFVGTAHAYAMKYFPKSNQDKLKEIVQAVRANIRNYIMRSIGYDWEKASENTKSFLNKLENADIMYAYPSWLLDKKLVANFYPNSMVVIESYFKNVEGVYKSVVKHNLKAYIDYNLPIIDINQLFKAFESDQIEVFEKNTNEIVIPVRVFSEANFPFFSSLLYDSMNYGSVAATLASEIYKKYLDSVEDINNITDCMNSQLPWGLTRAQAFDYKRKATAYLMGLLTAYEVWSTNDGNKNSLILFNESGVIPNAQLFFLSFAKTVCKNKNYQSINLDTKIQPFQCINLVASNVKEFQETFLCEDVNRKKQKCNPLKH